MLAALPITPKLLVSTVIVPALAPLPTNMQDLRAVTQLCSTAIQESGLSTRVQYGGGPARSLWQMEKMGGANEVLVNKATKSLALTVCAYYSVVPNIDAVFAALTQDDRFAAAWARLNYWRSPLPLPALGDANAAWSLYKTVWAPGKPRRVDWPEAYKQALDAATKG